MKVKGKEEKVRINQLKCGRTHCIALLNIGYIMEWGDNEYGQLGNKKRSQLNTPAVMRDFAGKKIVGVFAGEYCSGVIVEKNEQDDASKNPKK
jgi:alpha-tubulin suppressor-like RCC1 family protein